MRETQTRNDNNIAGIISFSGLDAVGTVMMLTQMPTLMLMLMLMHYHKEITGL